MERVYMCLWAVVAALGIVYLASVLMDPEVHTFMAACLEKL